MASLFDEKTGITITLDYDDEGFPEINIDLGNSYYDPSNFRPACKIELGGICIHENVDDYDDRWDTPKKKEGKVIVDEWEDEMELRAAIEKEKLNDDEIIFGELVASPPKQIGPPTTKNGDKDEIPTV
jgi:hypothetical protein